MTAQGVTFHVRPSARRPSQVLHSGKVMTPPPNPRSRGEQQVLHRGLDHGLQAVPPLSGPAPRPLPKTWVDAETRAGWMPYVALGRYRRYDAAEIAV